MENCARKRVLARVGAGAMPHGLRVAAGLADAGCAGSVGWNVGAYPALGLGPPRALHHVEQQVAVLREECV